MSPATPVSKFQLVYACRSAEALPAIQERASAMQALLQRVSEHADGAGGQLLRHEENAAWLHKSFRRVLQNVDEGVHVVTPRQCSPPPTS